MLQQNCRIEKFNGFKFYEKDILYDDYIFTHDIQIAIDLTYISPGFGITLMENESFSIKEKSNSYLFKIGYKEASIYYATKEECQLIKQITCPSASTIQENMKMLFTKTGKKIELSINGEKVFSEYIKKDLDKYNIGYYSNAGNIINNISIAAHIPDTWTVNMLNTQGGYIRFLTNSFEIIDCKNNAEVEQSNIKLKAGKYYLKVETESINNKNDIKYYVNMHDDDRLFDEEKTILREDNSFFLLKDSEINLKFVGTQGKVSNILMCIDKDDDYIPTVDDVINFEGSFIDVFIQDLKKITWKGTISRTPDPLTSDTIFGIILDNRTQVKPIDASLSFRKQYSYEFNVDNCMFYIIDNNVVIYTKRLTNLSNKITIFKNMTATIDELILYKKNGDIININVQDENKKYINANINSPIIAVDQYNIPLDLSSSYRVSFEGEYKKFIFTNWNREYFYPKDKIKLTRKVLNQDDSIIIYGILDDDIDLDKIYDIDNDNINSIDRLTRHYDVISEKDLLFLDKVENEIYFTEEQSKKYKMFIIDYLKDNSYCINFNYEKYAYEVNISSLNKNNKLLYDSQLIQNTSKQFYQVNNYKITDINGNINGYVVLKKGGF